MSVLHLMIGPPGAGKTTFVRRHMDKADVRVSMDEIQAMMGAEYGNYRAMLKPVYHAAETALITHALLQNRDVWVDRTNVEARRRRRYVDLAHTLKATVTAHDLCGKFSTDDLVKRRMTDPRGVTEAEWQGVIAMMRQQYNLPNLKEGFATLEFVSINELEVIELHAGEAPRDRHNG